MVTCGGPSIACGGDDRARQAFPEYCRATIDYRRGFRRTDVLMRARGRLRGRLPSNIDRGAKQRLLLLSQGFLVARSEGFEPRHHDLTPVSIPLDRKPLNGAQRHI